MTPNQWHARGVRILVALALAGRVEEASRVSAPTLEIEPSYEITSTRSVGLGRGLVEISNAGFECWACLNSSCPTRLQTCSSNGLVSTGPSVWPARGPGG